MDIYNIHIYMRVTLSVPSDLFCEWAAVMTGLCKLWTLYYNIAATFYKWHWLENVTC